MTRYLEEVLFRTSGENNENDLVKICKGIVSCKKICKEEKGCQSISYETSNRICRFSKIGSESNYYKEPCHLNGYEYTEILPR